MTMRRKPTPNPLPRSTAVRPTAPATEPPQSGYASILERARAMGLYAVVAILPLGCMTGSVVACGGARPVEAKSMQGPPGYVPPMETIAPPATSASTAPPPDDDQ
jgi:hypothetical protein